MEIEVAIMFNLELVAVLVAVQEVAVQEHLEKTPAQEIEPETVVTALELTF
jgi:hypothetical protein